MVSLRSAARWRKNWFRLSDRCRARLVVENDDKASLYSTQMLYDLIYSELGVPITFDYHHHKFHSSDLSEEQALKLASTTWPDDVRQCTHYSESRRDEYRRLLEAACAKHNIPLVLPLTRLRLALTRPKYKPILIILLMRLIHMG